MGRNEYLSVTTFEGTAWATKMRLFLSENIELFKLTLIAYFFADKITVVCDPKYINM